MAAMVTIALALDDAGYWMVGALAAVTVLVGFLIAEFWVTLLPLGAWLVGVVLLFTVQIVTRGSDYNDCGHDSCWFGPFLVLIFFVLPATPAMLIGVAAGIARRRRNGRAELPSQRAPADR